MELHLPSEDINVDYVDVINTILEGLSGLRTLLLIAGKVAKEVIETILDHKHVTYSETGQCISAEDQSISQKISLNREQDELAIFDRKDKWANFYPKATEIDSQTVYAPADVKTAIYQINDADEIYGMDAKWKRQDPFSVTFDIANMENDRAAECFRSYIRYYTCFSSGSLIHDTFRIDLLEQSSEHRKPDKRALTISLYSPVALEAMEYLRDRSDGGTHKLKYHVNFVKGFLPNVQANIGSVVYEPMQSGAINVVELDEPDLIIDFLRYMVKNTRPSYLKGLEVISGVVSKGLNAPELRLESLRVRGLLLIFLPEVEEPPFEIPDTFRQEADTRPCQNALGIIRETPLIGVCISTPLRLAQLANANQE